MKNYLFSILIILIFAGCTSQKNSEEFINATSGRYLFNANEVLEIYFKEQVLHAKWRGNDNIALLKVNDSSFYMKELNEKMLFVSKPEMHIELAPKTEHDGVIYHFKKLTKGEKTASEYFKDKEYNNALIAFKKIQEKDSLNPEIKERRINRLGYNYIRNKEIDAAIEIFKINIALYPNSSNVYDSMGDAFLSKKDTAAAITYYKKAISINPENSSAKKAYKKLTSK
ncbi:tetratricopeptide repeat protein [uncultured Polaribacter sp.]|uniref:tetratricopeptide repeat protein n=1 Tax=uncultured Polaribacter sp. TaxID=174711 RepID=UPI0026230B9B|nr:tetratricopeptide repeat protein [uncultured Polaribacter sp.]